MNLQGHSCPTTTPSTVDHLPVGVGDNATIAGIEIRNSPGWGLVAFNISSGTYANGGLIYQMVVHDNGMDARRADNGTGIVITGGSKNWCVVDSEVYNTFNGPTGPDASVTGNGGNSDGIANNFGSSNNSFIAVRVHHTGDDGIDMWKGGQSFWYFADVHDAGKVPQPLTGDGNGVKMGSPGDAVSHKFYKSSANNNKKGGWNLNGNSKQPTCFNGKEGCAASGNPTGDYINGMAVPK